MDNREKLRAYAREIERLKAKLDALDNATGAGVCVASIGVEHVDVETGARSLTTILARGESNAHLADGLRRAALLYEADLLEYTNARGMYPTPPHSLN